jgi:hypothetical protein
MKCLTVFHYREKCVYGARFHESHPWMLELRALVPRYSRDNHQVCIFDVGNDTYGHDTLVAVYFHDNFCYLGDIHSIQDGDEAEFWRNRAHDPKWNK